MSGGETGKDRNLANNSLFSFRLVRQTLSLHQWGPRGNARGEYFLPVQFSTHVVRQIFTEQARRAHPVTAPRCETPGGLHSGSCEPQLLRSLHVLQLAQRPPLRMVSPQRCPGAGGHIGLLDPIEVNLVRLPCHWTPVSWAAKMASSLGL